MTRRSIATPRAAVAVVVLAFASGVAAQGAGAAGSAKGAGAKAGSAILTPAQLRNCLDQKERLQKRGETAAAAKTQIDSQKADIDRMEGELAAESARLDRTSEEAVNAFNAKVARRDRLLEAYQAEVDAYNAQAREAQAAKSAHEKSCENQRYDERDLDDLKRRK
ncbi:MAG TPA: hypothetical protein VHM00_12540 [Caldimonas sp.]|jgi:hypothetical protein|nr:hypothetical protein [Caldimonas sp.]HEX2541897.1 hypothetical protein [Caldimonas sp.]